MSEINYQSVKDYISDRIKTSFDPVYLIFGEEYLYKQVVASLVNAIIPDQTKQKHNYEVVRQKEEGQLVDVLERINTYSFFSEKKIVELRDATLFVTFHNNEKLLNKVKQAFENNEPGKASNFFLNLLSRLNLDLEDLSDNTIGDKLNISQDQSYDIDWIKKLIAYCSDNRLSVPEAGDDAERLKSAIENGFPKDNFLFISTDTIDKRKGLYKTIKKFGTVIDCAVAKGSRKVDRDEQRRFLLQHMKQLAKTNNKQVDPRAFDLMVKMIGFDLRGFSSNMEKMIDYVGVRETITIDDARAVLNRLRQDPIYEITGAVSEKDTLKALYYLSSLLSSGYHYLQILTAITNQIRRLLLIKGFVESSYGGDWRPGMSFDRFKSLIIPSIRQYDEALLAHISDQKNLMKGNINIDPAGSKPKKKDATDLIIAKNPNNPYPIYQMFLRSENFSKKDLCASFEILNQTDVKLKTTGQTPRFVLEEAVLAICRKT